MPSDRHRDVRLPPERPGTRGADGVARDRGARERGDRRFLAEHAFGRGLRGRGLVEPGARSRGRRSAAPRARRARSRCRSGPCSTAAARGRGPSFCKPGSPSAEPACARRSSARRASVVAATNRRMRPRRERGFARRFPLRARGRRLDRSATHRRAERELDATPSANAAPCRGVPQQLGVGPRATGPSAEVAYLAVHRHDEVVARARARDVEQAQLLVEAHLLVDRLVQLELVGVHTPTQAGSRSRRSGGNSTCTPRPPSARGRGHARHDHDRELEALGAVDGQDAHRVVVGLGQHGLDDPRPFGALAERPREVVAQASRDVASLNARAWSTTNRIRRATSRKRPADSAELEHAPLPDDAFEQLARRQPRPCSCSSREVRDRLGDRMVDGQRVGQRSGDVPRGRRARRGT